VSGVSVVIAAYDEERHVGRLLRSLALQTLPPAEVIVADDGSRDRTAAVAEEHGATVLRLPHRGPAFARNAGVEAADGKIVVFADADMTCDREFLERLTDPIRTGRAVGSFSRDIWVGNPEDPWAQCYCAIRRLPFPRVLPADFPDEWDQVRAIRREPFLAVGGYDDVGYGEDKTVSEKLGEPAAVAPGAVLFHFNPDSLGEIFENARWIGRGRDIEFVDRPLRTNAPWVAIRRGVRDVRNGYPLRVLAARLAYHLGITVGYATKRLRPGRHWK
jgi:glycosyltransferase involved in cell wall biosynthesis